MNGLLVSCVICLIMAFIIIIKYTQKINEKEMLLDEYRQEYARSNYRIRNLEYEKTALMMENHKLRSQAPGQKIVYVNKNGPIEIPKGTVDAVKLAMKVSHPDNGGNNEDFIKYREVYMKLTKKSS